MDNIRPGPWQSGAPKRRIAPFEPFSPGKWQGLEPKPREWLVDGCFAPGTVVMLSGDGGLGKSLLMLQLQAAAALNRQWLGLDTRPVKSFGYYCEDDEDELHRRLWDICKAEDCDIADLGESVSMVSRVGSDDNVLVQADRHGNVTSTVIFDQVYNHAVNFGAQIVILDTLADIFDGNEIQRSVARKCITILRKLAVRIQGCVIITAHPSLTGISSGSGLSGSTGWNGAVRQRLYLTRAKSDDDEGGNDERLLKTMKNNYGPDGGKIRLKWDRGVFVRIDGQQGQPTGLFDKLDLDRKLTIALRKMVENGTFVAAAHEARSSFSSLMRAQPEFRGYSHSAIVAAQERLLESGAIVRVEMGPPTKRRKYVRTPDTLYPGEVRSE